jgi:hypothetical protein
VSDIYEKIRFWPGDLIGRKVLNDEWDEHYLKEQDAYGLIDILNKLLKERLIENGILE